MPEINPLLVTLAEAKHDGCDEHEALLRMMCTIQMSKHPLCITAAAAWHERYGEPTYERMEEWAAEYAADPENAEAMRRLRRQHEAVMASLAEEDRARIRSFSRA